MSKSLFRIIAFRCLQPEGEHYYVNHMQRSLSSSDKWYKFYRNIEIDEDGNHIIIPRNFADDAIIYDTDSLSISVSAIVGENGSGKSSILDMMVRMLNNVATALLGEKPQYAAAEHLHYIEHVYGSILLVQNEKVKRLDIRSRVVKMIEYKKVEREHNDNRIDYRVGSHEIWLDARNANIDNLLPRQTNSLYKLTELFYTVVCNYSLYAYNPNDY